MSIDDAEESPVPPGMSHILDAVGDSIACSKDAQAAEKKTATQDLVVVCRVLTQALPDMRFR